ncbi:MAG: 8-oxo-dGTP diphosphatase MutT [Pseudomonadota bacterium]
MTRQRVQVVAAVIRAQDGRVLLAQRPQYKHQGGLWEFPGGKVEPGETEVEALQRELHEELGLWAETLSPLIRIQHDYPDKSVELSVWQVTQWRGETYGGAASSTAAGAMQGRSMQGRSMQGHEGQPVMWVAPDEFLKLPFPAANGPIVAAARLPAIWRITPALGSLAEVQRWAEQRLRSGLNAPADAREGWLLRLPEWSLDNYVLAAEALVELKAAAKQASGVVRAPIALCLHGDLSVLQRVPSADALHLNHHQVQQLIDNGQTVASLRSRAGQLVSAAAHSEAELAASLAAGVDSAWLSPVLMTPSHPEAAPLGWATWAQWLAKVPMPIYALGGVTATDVRIARSLGGQGVAGISQF